MSRTRDIERRGGPLGFDDGEQTPVGEMLRAVERIAWSVDVPVTADLEAGYGDPPATAAAVWVAGAVGMNFEDSRSGELVPLDEQIELVRSLCAAAPSLVVNARVDVFISGDGDLDEAVERGNAYLEAGARCVYPIDCPRDAIEELARRIDGPINGSSARVRRPPSSSGWASLAPRGAPGSRTRLSRRRPGSLVRRSADLAVHAGRPRPAIALRTSSRPDLTSALPSEPSHRLLTTTDVQRRSQMASLSSKIHSGCAGGVRTVPR